MEFPLPNLLPNLIVSVFVWFLAAFYRPLLLFVVILVSSFAVIQYFMLNHPALKESLAIIKFLAVIPIGLGSILTFSLISAPRQKAYQRLFSYYINVAVIANIAMMLAAPADGTLRGQLSRLLCLALVCWLIQELVKVRGRSSFVSDGFFLFNSSPLAWILCHSCYRAALLSLPIFDSEHYFLLEPLSLTMMYGLYKTHRKRFPVHFYFGFADTLVVSALVFSSHLLQTPNSTPSFFDRISLSNFHFDVLFVPIQLIAFTIACRFIWLNHKSISLPK
jgi:hypothetical protein